MWDMSLEWWEFIARGAIVYLSLMIIVRMSGKRTIGQFTPFDLLVVMLISEAVSGSMTGGDESLIGGMIVVVTMILLNVVIAYIASRSVRLENMIEGREVLLGRDGKIFEDVLKAHRIGRNEVDRALHASDMTIEEMGYLILEADGTISVVTKNKGRHAPPFHINAT